MAAAVSHSLLEWSDSLSVGVREIDGQHKRIVNLINCLQDAMAQGKGKDILAKILSELLDYTKVHFAAEERMMLAAGYANLQVHKLEHEKLTEQVLSFQREFQAGRAMISIEVMQFLKTWLQNHIAGSDKKYTQHLNAKGIR